MFQASWYNASVLVSECFTNFWNNYLCFTNWLVKLILCIRSSIPFGNSWSMSAWSKLKWRWRFEALKWANNAWHIRQNGLSLRSIKRYKFSYSGINVLCSPSYFLFTGPFFLPISERTSYHTCGRYVRSGVCNVPHRNRKALSSKVFPSWRIMSNMSLTCASYETNVLIY